MYKKLQRGFTLVELIIVVALVGLIAIIAVPRMTNAINMQRAERDAGMMEVFLKSARSLAIANNQMVRIFDENEANTEPYKLSGALKAFYSKLNSNEYNSMKKAASECTDDCVIISKPAVNSKAKTYLYYFGGSGYGTDFASIAFDANGSFYTSDRSANAVKLKFKAGETFLVWHYNLDNQQRALILCPSGSIKSLKGADANISVSTTGVIPSVPNADICK